MAKSKAKKTCKVTNPFVGLTMAEIYSAALTFLVANGIDLADPGVHFSEGANTVYGCDYFGKAEDSAEYKAALRDHIFTSKHRLCSDQGSNACHRIRFYDLHDRPPENYAREHTLIKWLTAGYETFDNPDPNSAKLKEIDNLLKKFFGEVLR